MLGIILCSLPLLIIIIGSIIVGRMNKKTWNKGACGYCNKGFWVSFDMCSGGETGYKCTNCDRSFWM